MQARDIPYGYCQCGCGEKTRVSPHTSRAHGYVKGEPRRFIKGHSKRKPERRGQCAYCGESIYLTSTKLKNSNQYCSHSCYVEARWGAIGTLYCEQCGGEVQHDGQRKQRYCSQSCYWQNLKTRKHPERSRTITKPCDWCGKSKTRPASEMQMDKTFCNVRCMAEWQSAFVRRETHPRWKGGDGRISYGVGWKAARARIYTRSNGVCEDCGKRPARDVHHIMPVRFFARNSDAHFDSNLIALCSSCHGAAHRKLSEEMPLLDLLQAQSSTP